MMENWENWPEALQLIDDTVEPQADGAPAIVGMGLCALSGFSLGILGTLAALWLAGWLK